MTARNRRKRWANPAATWLIDAMGGLQAVASVAGVSRQAVLKWRVHGIPPARFDDLQAKFPGLDLSPGKGAGR